MDFTILKSEEIFGKQNEIYIMKPEKQNLNCEYCLLVMDYTKVCAHYTMNAPQMQQQYLKEMLAEQSGEKMKMLIRLAQNLDVLSTYKMTALMLAQNQFSDLLMMFISKEGC